MQTMIIDFHAHLYPEKIAAKASKAIGDFYNTSMSYKGTAEELISSGSKIGVTKYLVHPLQLQKNRFKLLMIL